MTQHITRCIHPGGVVAVDWDVVDSSLTEESAWELMHDVTFLLSLLRSRIREREKPAKLESVVRWVAHG